MTNYPDDEELEKIERWDAADFIGWMIFIESIWTFCDWGWSCSAGEYDISTGGWSGNESIISAMQNNVLLWMTHWESQRRGGHYRLMTMEASRKARLR